MSYTAGNLHLRAGAPADLTYTYDAGADTLATVLVAGYFNNSDDNLNLVADDLIFIKGNDGNCWTRVSAVSSGSVTLQWTGGTLPVRTASTGTGDASRAIDLESGIYAIASDVCTATHYVLAVPYPGAEIKVYKDASMVTKMVFDAGASDGTGITFDNRGTREITLVTEGDGFHVLGQSATRWQITQLMVNHALATAGASLSLLGT